MIKIKNLAGQDVVYLARLHRLIVIDGQFLGIIKSTPVFIDISFPSCCARRFESFLIQERLELHRLNSLNLIGVRRSDSYFTYQVMSGDTLAE